MATGKGVIQGYTGVAAVDGQCRMQGRRKVDTQWKMYCLVHNIEKLAHYGYAQ